MPGPRPVLRQADSIVRHGHHHVLRVAVHLDVHPLGLGMAQRIDDPFLDHAIDRQRDAGPEIRRQSMAQRQGHGRVPPLPVARQILEGGRQTDGVEGERRESWYEAMHGIVQTRRLVRYQTRDSGGGIVAPVGLGGDRQGETADGRDRLAEFIVQFVRDQAPLFLHPLIRQGGHFAALLELRLGVARLALRVDLVFHGLRHAVEGDADGARLVSGERRQPVAQRALLNAIQRLGNDGKGFERARDAPERQDIDDDDHGGAEGGQAHDVVPGVQYGAGRLSLDHQQQAAAQREGHFARLRGQQP
jgi:hypothetical protein